MKKFLLAAAVVCATALFPASALGGSKAEATVTFDIVGSDMGPNGPRSIYIGTISSEKRACKAERRVIVYRQLDGDDEKMGSARSKPADGPWEWKVRAPGALQVGTYYARAPKTDKCEAAKSGLVGVS